jgi:hypothetical protein
MSGPHSLRPGEFWIFDLGFEPPVEKAKVLYVELPSPIVKSKEKFKFQLPINVEPVTYTPPVVERFARALPKPLTTEILFKRKDFHHWFSKWNRSKEKKTPPRIRDDS